MKNFKLIACEIFYREFCAVVARSIHRVDVTFLPKGLHDIGAASMKEKLQQAIDQVDIQNYDAILLGYALCNNGTVGLKAPNIPLVIPRAHDCITLFLGSHTRYEEYFRDHPGSYFLTTGWIERGGMKSGDSELRQLSMHNLHGFDKSLDELIEKYGEENARYLYETLGNLIPHYERFTFIEMGIEPDDRFLRYAESEALKRNLRFECLQGSLVLFQELVDGQWTEEKFLNVPPGQIIKRCYDDQLIQIGGTP